VREPGSGSGAGSESEAVVVPIEPQDNTTCGEGRPLLRSRVMSAKEGPVSAGQASSAAVGSVRDPVRALQRTLYRSAKADPGRRFHALRDKVYRRDVLWRAWVMVAAGSLSLRSSIMERLFTPVKLLGQSRRLVYGARMRSAKPSVQ
jgi:hypothetical protein